ncbi:MAG: trypsin-like peptidase domain-containing protein [Alphaproteobacteria bacterium]|nr:trypsin-like peptidase domain-containing protein [Alphaproteobacteria bacterium]
MKKIVLFLMFLFILEGSAYGDSGRNIKGGVQRLIKSVVDVIVSERTNPEELLEKKESSDGSGFLIDENGYVVTNCHVIDGAEKIKIVIYDGTEYFAKVIGRDERSDIALLKIEASTKLPYATLADSDKVEITDPVIAIGNPFGFGKTVTAGIISYKGRNLSKQIAELGTGGDLVSYLQTDAQVNYGNSGGPLFSYDGEVVGMITVFLSDGTRGTGINFAIPSNTLKKVITQLRNYGKMQRSWIGISVVPLNKESASALGLGKRCGFVVSKVDSNSPATKIGIHDGDIVLSINDIKFSENTNSEDVLNNLPINAIIPIQIMKDGEERKYSITVEGRSDDDFPFDTDNILENKNIPFEKLEGVNIGVTELTGEYRRLFEVPSSVKGVLVAQAGDGVPLNQGNVIISVNQKETQTVAALKKEIEKRISNGKNNVAFYLYDAQIGRADYVTVPLKLSIGAKRSRVSDILKQAFHMDSLSKKAATTK